MPQSRLRADFPFRPAFDQFLTRYLRRDCSLWYLPKYTLTENNIAKVQKTLEMLIDEFEGQEWNRDLQDTIRKRLLASQLISPYTAGRALEDRTAIVRVELRKFFEYLGLAWIPRGSVHVTDVGLEVATQTAVRPLIEAQIAKFQYPNPVTGKYGPETTSGILPHLFLLQCILQCDGRITTDEFKLFLNLAESQDDLDETVRLIHLWRDLSDKQREQIDATVSNTQRYRQIAGLISYQRAFFCYPTYLQHDPQEIRITDARAAFEAVAAKASSLKIANYESQADWFAYYGDPSKSPSWFEYLTTQLDRADSGASAKQIVDSALKNPDAKKVLTPEQVREIKRKEVEKDIETFYVRNLHQIEKGLSLVQDGRQFTTEIGRMDLLCRAADGMFVVIEIKAGKAEDGVFGQVLRYIGWVHTNLKGGQNNVRGIILAGQFPEEARYSRIGLLKDNHKGFLKFKEHGLTPTDI